MMGARRKDLTLLEIVTVLVCCFSLCYGVLRFSMAMMFVLREAVDNTIVPSSASRDVAQPEEVERSSRDHF